MSFLDNRRQEGICSQTGKEKIALEGNKVLGQNIHTANKKGNVFDGDDVVKRAENEKDL